MHKERERERQNGVEGRMEDGGWTESQQVLHHITTPSSLHSHISSLPPPLLFFSPPASNLNRQKNTRTRDPGYLLSSYVASLGIFFLYTLNSGWKKDQLTHIFDAAGNPAPHRLLLTNFRQMRQQRALQLHSNTSPAPISTHTRHKGVRGARE